MAGGFLETMLYDFRILSPTALTSRDAVKQASQAGSNAIPPQFVDVSGTKISPDLQFGAKPNRRRELDDGRMGRRDKVAAHVLTVTSTSCSFLLQNQGATR